MSLSGRFHNLVVCCCFRGIALRTSHGVSDEACYSVRAETCETMLSEIVRGLAVVFSNS
jgi:hypothetical protein